MNQEEIKVLKAAAGALSKTDGMALRAFSEADNPQAVLEAFRKCVRKLEGKITDIEAEALIYVTDELLKDRHDWTELRDALKIYTYIRVAQH